MIKEETLSKLNLEELIGTTFEEMMEVRKISAGEVIVEKACDKLKACFISQGSIQMVTYTIDGKEFYRYLFPGDIFGVTNCFIGKIKKDLSPDYGTDIRIREDSVLVYLPLGKIMDMEVEGKEEVLKKLLLMTVEEKVKESSHFLGKAVYSDEEFIIKALERIGIIKAVNTRELAMGLNMNLRNLQRLLNKLEKLEIIAREGGKISIKDFKKFDEYRKSLEE